MAEQQGPEPQHLCHPQDHRPGHARHRPPHCKRVPVAVRAQRGAGAARELRSHGGPHRDVTGATGEKWAGVVLGRGNNLLHEKIKIKF